MSRRSRGPTARGLPPAPPACTCHTFPYLKPDLFPSSFPPKMCGGFSRAPPTVQHPCEAMVGRLFLEGPRTLSSLGPGRAACRLSAPIIPGSRVCPGRRYPGLQDEPGSALQRTRPKPQGPSAGSAEPPPTLNAVMERFFMPDTALFKEEYKSRGLACQGVSGKAALAMRPGPFPGRSPPGSAVPGVKARSCPCC